MLLTFKERNHLLAVIAYLYKDEANNFECQGRPKDHIFNSLLCLQEIVWRGNPAQQPTETEEVGTRPNGDPTAGSPIGIVRDHPSHGEDLRNPDVVTRGSREIEQRWAKETVGLVAVELNEAYAQFDTSRDNGLIPTDALCQASRRLEEAMRRLGLTDEIPF